MITFMIIYLIPFKNYLNTWTRRNLTFPKNIYVFDLETCNKDDGAVWSAGLIGDGYYEAFLSLDKMFETLINRFKSIHNKWQKRGTRIKLYAHNMSNFDGHILLRSYFQKNNIPQVLRKDKSGTTIYHTKSSFRLKQESDPNEKTPFPHYKAFMTADSSIVNIDYYLKPKHIIEFKCSMKFLGGNSSVKALGQTLKIPELRKGKLDHNQCHCGRYKTVEEFKADKDTYNYLKNDCAIVYETLKGVHNLKDKNDNHLIRASKWKSTIASTAFNLFIRGSSEWLFEQFEAKYKTHPPRKNGKLQRFDCVMCKSSYYGDEKFSRHIFDHLFPPPTNEILTTQMRKALAGGLTTYNPDYVGEKMKNIMGLDINSSYPAVMINNDFPIGDGVPGDGGEGYPLKLYRLSVTKTMTQNKTIPFIRNSKVKHTDHFNYSYHIKAGENFIVTSAMLKRFFKYYDKNNFVWSTIWSWKNVAGSKIFGPHINRWYDLKLNSKKSGNDLLYFFSKIVLNATFGKFVSRVRRKSVVFNPELNETPNDAYEKEETEKPYEYPFPMGLFILDYARCVLIDKEVSRKDFVYCDTDSIYLKNYEKNKHKFKIHDNELGAWKMEENNVWFCVLRQKRYWLMRKDGNVKIVMSGYKTNPERVIDRLTRSSINLQDITWKRFFMGNYAYISGQKMRTFKGLVIKDVIKEGQGIHENLKHARHPEAWFKNINDLEKKYGFKLPLYEKIKT